MLLNNQASRKVNRTAGRGGHDDGDLLGREGLRVRLRGRERGAGKCEAGEEKLLAVHGGFFPILFVSALYGKAHFIRAKYMLLAFIDFMDKYAVCPSSAALSGWSCCVFFGPSDYRLDTQSPFSFFHVSNIALVSALGG